MDLWDCSDGAPPGAYATMVAHPRFPAAAHALGVATMELARERTAIAVICRDAGRYVTALAAFTLSEEGELTLPRIKAACARTGLLSPGRVRTCVQLLEHVGYLDRLRDGRGTRPGAYRPSDRFHRDWVGQLRRPITAAALIEPVAGRILPALEEPGTLRLFLRLQGAELLASAASGRHASAFFDAFYHPLGGLQILSWIIASGDGTAFPPTAAVPLHAAELASAFGLTPMQVRRVLRGAREGGFLEVQAGGRHALTEASVEPLRYLYAAQLVHLLVPIGRALRQIGPPLPGPPFPELARRVPEPEQI